MVALIRTRLMTVKVAHPEIIGDDAIERHDGRRWAATTVRGTVGATTVSANLRQFDSAKVGAEIRQTDSSSSRPGRLVCVA
jgi:hypothetical protein